MKKLVLAVAFVCVSQFGFAQDEAFKKDVLKVIEKDGSTDQIKMAKSQILKMIPSDKQAAFNAEFDASLVGLYDKMATVYMATYTKEDIKAMLAFYESPVGKKMNEKSGEITEKTMAATQEWGQGLQGVMMKYVQE